MEVLCKHKKSGVRYECYADKTACAIRGSSEEEIPSNFRTSFKKFVVTSFGKDSYHKNKVFYWSGESLTFAEDSNVSYFGKVIMSNIRMIRFPKSLMDINSSTFEHTRLLTDISIDEGNDQYKMVGKILMHNENELIVAERDIDTDITIPANVIEIKSFCFAYLKKTNLQIEFTSPSSLILIGTGAFLETNLTNICIPASVKILGDNCFCMCKELENITFPPDSKLESIGCCCFLATKITRLEIPPKLRVLGYEALYNRGLIEADFSNNKNFIFEDDALYDGRKTTLKIVYPTGSNTFEIPSTVLQIDHHAFKYSNISHVQFAQDSKCQEVNLNSFSNQLEVLVLSPTINMITNKGSPAKLPKLSKIVVANPTNFKICIKSVLQFNKNTEIFALNSTQIETIGDSFAIERVIRKVNDISYLTENNHMNNNKRKQRNNYEIDLRRFKKLDTEIGKGGFGQTKLVEDIVDGNIYAMKIVKKNKELADPIEYFNREVVTMCKAMHPCIVRIIGFSKMTENEAGRIIMEYLPGGTLRGLIFKMQQKEPIPYFNNTRKAIIVLGICFGMRYLHKLEIIHRDLKPDNIFLDENLKSRIGDFGYAKFLPAGSLKTMNIGSMRYNAPEMSNSDDYTFKLDVYGFGLILWELANESRVFEEYQDLQLMKKKLENPVPVIAPSLLPLTKLLIRKSCALNPNDRFSFDEIIQKIAEENYELFPDIDVSKVQAFCGEMVEYERDNQ